jgi:prevent-host-death family protein
MLTSLPNSNLGHIIMTMTAAPREIPAGRFKAECLALLDRVAATGETYIVTKHGRPVAQIAPLSKASTRSLKGSVAVTGDIVGPVLGDWDVEG